MYCCLGHGHIAGGAALTRSRWCAAAAVAACRGHDKLRANAVRALGYLLASPSPCEEGIGQGVSGSQVEDGSDAQPSASASEQAPGWFQEAAQQLQDALRTGNGKVSWNACYAVGSLLRSQRAAGLAHERSCLLPLLWDLLGALQHSKNHKVRGRIQVIEPHPTTP